MRALRLYISSFVLLFSIGICKAQSIDEFYEFKDDSFFSITQDSLPSLLDSSQNLINQNKFEQALFICIKIIKATPYIQLTIKEELDLNDRLASCMSGLKAYDFGIAHTKRALEISKTNDTINPFEFRWRLGRIGTFFIYDGQYDSAISYFRKSVPWAIQEKQPIFIASSYNNIGIAYSKQNNLDSAYFYFDLAKKTMLFKSHNDSSFATSVNDNIAELLDKEGKYIEAERYYLWNFKLWSKRKDKYSKQIYSGLKWAGALLKIRDLNTALATLPILESLCKKNDDRESLLIVHRLYKEYYSIINQPKEILYYTSKELELITQLKEESEETARLTASQLSEYSIIKIRQNLKLERLERQSQENLLKLSEQKAINTLLWIWTFVIASAMAFILLYFNYRKKINQKKLEQEKLDTELALKKKDLEDFALNLTRKQEWTKEISESLEKIRDLDHENYARGVQSLLNEIKNEQLMEKRKKVFQNNVQEINHQFYERLNVSYPNLTKTERELAGLLRIGLSNKEIADLRSTEVASVKKGRNRLRKKLDLDPKTDIYVFVSSI